MDIGFRSIRDPASGRSCALRRSGELIGLRGSPTVFLNDGVVDVSFGLEHLEHAVRTALGEP
jgi:hypothetical protein